MPVSRLLLALAICCSQPANAQTLTYRGFGEARTTGYPQDAPNDSRHLIADALLRAELFVRPMPGLAAAAGLDARANNDAQVVDSWRLEVADRGVRRPRLSMRRASVTVNRRALTLEVGKQFIRWGKADIVTPTDRFAPRDYLNVIDSDFIAVRAVRASIERGPTMVDAVWAPFFTPSRLPLFDRRWTVVPPGVTLVHAPNLREPAMPERAQAGVRWGYNAGRYEYSMSFYDGFNHLPAIDQGLIDIPSAPGGPIVVEVARRYPALRMYGGDAAVPTRWFTFKGEAAYFTSKTAATDEYVLYVAQIERQAGEWLLVGGYAGEVVTRKEAAIVFAPDRGTARTILGRASYTIDANRSAAVEGALREDGRGLYLKGEYSQARGVHWRVTTTGAIVRGASDDFLGQYRRNSHLALALRYSF
jgi:hypothetical protein